MTDWTSLKVLCNFQSATKVFRVMRWSEFHHVIKKCISSDYFKMQCLRIFSSLNSFLWSWPEYHGCVWVSGDVHRASVTEQLGDLERLRRGRRERERRGGDRGERCWWRIERGDRVNIPRIISIFTFGQHREITAGMRRQGPGQKQ